MADARRVRAEILYDGKEVGLSARVEKVSYTDNDYGRADEISLTFSDRDRDWLMQKFIPEKEHNLDVSLWFHRWHGIGVEKYHCGNFTIDDITYSGTPSECVIKGVSVPASSDFQVVPKSKTWEKVTIKQIAEEKMKDYGMTSLFYNMPDPDQIYEKIEQDNESDSEFLFHLCEERGFFIKVYKVGLVIFDKNIYEPRGPKAIFNINDLENFRWNTTLTETYTGAVLEYTNPATKDANGKTIRKKENMPDMPKTLSTTVGEGPRLLYLSQSADDEAEARRIAAAAVNEANEKAVTVSFRCMANVNLYATDNFELTGMGRMNGKYYTQSVTHSVGQSGESMTVTGYKIFERMR